MDKHHGASGTFIVKDGERVPASPDSEGMVRVGEQVLHRPQTRPHADGDAPRDAKGNRLDRDAAAEAAAKPRPAMPEPVAPPWLSPTPPSTAAAGEASNDTPRSPRAVK